MTPIHAALLAFALLAQAEPVRRPQPAPYAVPDVPSKDDAGLRAWVELYETDSRNIESFYDIPWSATTGAAFRPFHNSWKAALDRIDFEKLGVDGRVDYLLLRNRVESDERRMSERRRRFEELTPLLPFARAIADLKETRQRVEPLDPAKAATKLNELAREIEALSAAAQSGKAPKVKRTEGRRAAAEIAFLQQMLRSWFDFYSGYDPAFSWWAADPFKKVNAALNRYAGITRERLAGLRPGDRDTILGDPIGRESLLADLKSEMIPYTPEQLVEIANREFAWCDREMLRASRDLGFGDDWRKALEHVKTLHVAPGEQPALIQNLALEAIEYLEKNDLITVPALARDTWRMNMMSPEAQRVSPFFLGGEGILVSYPTDTMTHEEKMMSMRGNNIHFSRAVVHHELIPGHNLQLFMRRRFLPYRAAFNTPFWNEGWALYWEMALWDRGFPATAENRIGMLFWRMHRCARIIFSLNFHLEKMTAQESVDFLVDRVGHERANAAGEVRRSFEVERFGPLYQSAYMLGALQFRALAQELVASGRMKPREFHDRILKLNSIPVELVRASLTGQRLARDFKTSWKFYGDLP